MAAAVYGSTIEASLGTAAEAVLGACIDMSPCPCRPIDIPAPLLADGDIIPGDMYMLGSMHCDGWHCDMSGVY